MLRSHLSHVPKSVPNLPKIFHASLPFPPTFPSTPTPPAVTPPSILGHTPSLPSLSAASGAICLGAFHLSTDQAITLGFRPHLFTFSGEAL